LADRNNPGAARETPLTFYDFFRVSKLGGANSEVEVERVEYWPDYDETRVIMKTVHKVAPSPLAYTSSFGYAFPSGLIKTVREISLDDGV
jgi:hypothetical protein